MIRKYFLRIIAIIVVVALAIVFYHPIVSGVASQVYIRKHYLDMHLRVACRNTTTSRRSAGLRTILKVMILSRLRSATSLLRLAFSS
jgi:hypothetical protein